MIELKEITFDYNGNEGKENFRLDNVSLKVNPGDFLTILGPNGSGKSTMLKIASGYLTPHYGKVLLKEKEIRNYSAKERAKIMAYVPQNYSTIYSFSIYEIVAMGRTPHMNIFGFERDSDRKKIREALELMELTHLAGKGIGEVSGGEAQRAFIARALVQEPDVIFLDEPSAHLDIKHQISILEQLSNLNKEKKITVILVSHDLNLTGNYSARTVMMKKGKILLDGNTTDVLTEENISRVFAVSTEVSLRDNKISVLINP